MAYVIHRRTILEFSANLKLEEVEIRALDALVGYGDDAFIGVFKEKLGAAYLRDHEAGLRSFFDTVRRQLLPSLRDIDETRKGIEKHFKGEKL